MTDAQRRHLPRAAAAEPGARTEVSDVLPALALALPLAGSTAVR